LELNTNLDISPYVLMLNVLGRRLMEALKETLVIKMTWRAFTRLRMKHPDLKFDIDNGQFLFTDSSVTLHLRPEVLNGLTYTQIH